jgi:hypothetical protein
MTSFFDETERQLLSAARKGRQLSWHQRIRRHRRSSGSRAGAGLRPVIAGAAGLLIVAATTATAASLIGSDPPRPGAGGGEVIGDAGYVIYWRDGVLSKIVNCGETPEAMECRGDLWQQRKVNVRILDETSHLIKTGNDRSAGVLFMTANGGLLSCSGNYACSFLEHEPNWGKKLPALGTPVPPRYTDGEL